MRGNAGGESRARANQRLMERMRVLHQQTREAYGARKMWQLLNREGLICGRHRVARFRRLAGIVALCRRRYVRTVQVRQHETPAIPNRLNQQFAVSPRIACGPGIYVRPTRTGWLTVAVLLDLYSRRIVGWAMSPRQTLSVVVEALWMAWQRRRPAPGLVHHSDQGNQYRRVSIRPLSAARGGREHESEGQLLRQCAGGELLQFAEERTGAASAVPRSGRSAAGDRGVYRGVL